MSTRWFLLAILTGSYGAGAFGVLGISPLSPSLVAGFGLTRLQVALIVPSIYFGGLLLSLPDGRLADRLGARPSLLGGLLIGAAGLAVGALSPSFATFLMCLFLAGIGWSVVNRGLGKAIMDLFPVHERGIAMGIKQMGLTLGGIAAALVLPRVAAALGWRAAIATCALDIALPVVLSWRPLGRLDDAPARPPSVARDDYGARLGLGAATGDSHLLRERPSARDGPGRGAELLAALHDPGARIRPDRRRAPGCLLAGRRRGVSEPPAIAGSPTVARCGSLSSFASYAVWLVSTPAAAGALAFATGIGAYGWVGIFFVISAELGGSRMAGLLSGMAFASIVIGLLVGPVTFGLLPVRWDSYTAPWTAFAVLSAVAACATLVISPAIERERR